MASRCVQTCGPRHLGRPGRESSGQPIRDFNPFAAWTSGRCDGALRGWGCAFPGSALSQVTSRRISEGGTSRPSGDGRKSRPARPRRRDRAVARDDERRDLRGAATRPTMRAFTGEPHRMSLKLTLIFPEYARFAPLVNGDVKPEGIDLVWLRGPRTKTLPQALNDPAVEGGEHSLAQHLYRVAAGDRAHVGLPI